jgi:hypothetical protein
MEKACVPNDFVFRCGCVKKIIHRKIKSFAAQIIGLCSKRSKTIDRNVSNFCLNRFSHLSQPNNNIFNATVQIASDLKRLSRTILNNWCKYLGNPFIISVYKWNEVAKGHSKCLKRQWRKTIVTAVFTLTPNV